MKNVKPSPFYIIAGEKKNIFHREIEFLQMTFEVIINRGSAHSAREIVLKRDKV